MHTEADRRRAAVERERQHAAEQYRDRWRRRLSGSLAATVTTSAAGVVLAAPLAMHGIGHLYKPYSATSQIYPYAQDTSDQPDYPHTPEGNQTFYTPWYGGGTATTIIRVGPETPIWNSWEWTHGSDVLGD